jgi:SAM-dependent methyltransferase
LDLGCGDGSLLRAIARHGSPADLAGVDIYPFRQQLDDSFKFFQGDVINFKIWPAVEVVISSQVVEHLAPADLGEHIRSVRQSLVENGTFVLMTPNRLWGPHDITRACDFTNSNRIPARGSHLNELTYRELITVLGTHGFTDLRTVFPFAHRLPGLSRIRIRPTINLLIEQSAFLRKLSYLIAWNGRAIYKNPIVLVARKA